MSENFTFYIVDEKKLPTQWPEAFSVGEKHSRLVEEIDAKGAQWDQVKITWLAFADALKAIDEAIEGDGFIPVLAFKNSPHEVLGENGDHPDLGYFSPEQAHALNLSLEVLADEGDEVELAGVDADVVDRVLHALRSSVAEAERRGYALAIVKS